MKSFKFFLRYALAGIVAVAMALSCSNPTVGDSSPVLNLNSPSEVLSRLPSFTIVLPKSLGDGGQNGSGSKALGDVSTLTDTNTESVKSYRFNAFRSQLEYSTIAVFVDLLRQIGNNNPNFQLGTEISTGTLQYKAMVFPDAGKIRAEKSSDVDGNYLDFFWNFNYQLAAQRFLVYIKVYESGKIFLLVDLPLATQSATSLTKVFCAYDPVTGDVTNISKSVNQYSGSVSKNSYLSVIHKNNDGSYTVKSGSTYNDSPTNWYLGYADDSFGAVINQYKGTYSGGGGSYNNIYANYYDANGDLVLDVWGDANDQGWTNQVASTYFGDSYYVSNRYPLKQLLPLKGSYASQYSVKQIEGETYIFWFGKNDQYHYWNSSDPGSNLNASDNPALANPSDIKYQDSWTGYSYWLEDITDGDNDMFDGGVDIQLSDVHNEEVWYWENGQAHKTKAPFVFTGNTLPAYFGLSSSNAANIARTTAIIEAQYQSLKNSSVDDYFVGFSELWPGEGKFPKP